MKVWLTYSEANHLSTKDGLQHVVNGVACADCTLLESGDGWVAFYPNEDGVALQKHQGYVLNYTLLESEDEYGVIFDYAIHENCAYDKLIRTHEEMKDELDRLWPVYDSFEQRILLERLYLFLGEMPPKC